MESIELEEEGRLTALPISNRVAWTYYEKGLHSHWTPAEIDGLLRKDQEDWRKVPRPARRVLKKVLPFFAVSDTKVVEIIQKALGNRIKTREWMYWYNAQTAQEDIHSIQYSKFIESLFRSPRKRARILEAASSIPTIQAKIDLVFRWLGVDHPLTNLPEKSKIALEKLFARYEESADKDPEIEALIESYRTPRPLLARQILINIIMEGLFFSSSFAFIFWVRDTLKLMPGLVKGNEFISRDEGLHTEVGIIIYLSLEYPLSEGLAHMIMKEAVEIECAFVRDALEGNDLLGMNASMMCDYVKLIADQILEKLHYSPLYGVKECPFANAEKQSYGLRITEFFTEIVSEYQKKGIEEKKPCKFEFDMNEDF